VERLKSNKTGVKNTHHKQYQVIEALKDLKVWMLVAAIFFHNMTNSLQTNVSFLPPLNVGDINLLPFLECVANNTVDKQFSGLVIRGLGYSVDESILLSIPPGIGS
jgi:MFS transporter, ACS family, allantoate permease